MEFAITRGNFQGIINMLLGHRGWKSDSMAEGYVETSVENKKIIATKITGSSVTVGSTN